MSQPIDSLQDLEPDSLSADAGPEPTPGQSDEGPDALSAEAQDEAIEVVGPEEGAAAEPETEADSFRPARLLLTPLQSGGETGERVPRKAERLELPDSAVVDIFRQLTGAFYAQTGIDLADKPDEIARFETEAARVRLSLEEMDAAVVELDGLMGTYFLHAHIDRETVMALQALRADDAAVSGSARPGDYLPPNYYLIPDPGRQRILLAWRGSDRTRFWEISLGQLGDLKQVRDLLWLPGQRMLLADAQARQVIELGLDGHARWRLDSERSPEHALRAPVRVSRYRDGAGKTRYLIVDQSQHRLFELTADQQIQWQYGVSGQSRDLEGYLNSPSDAQLTPQRTWLIADSGNHRVLEIRQGKTIMSLGESDGLDWPVYAERLEQGKTLVVDQLRHSVFVFDSARKRVHDCVFYAPGMDERFKTGKLNMVLRLPNNNLVLVDTERILELDWVNQSVVWFGSLRALDQPLISAPQALSARGGGRGLKPLVSDEAQAPLEIVTLRQMLANVPLFEGAPMPFFFDQLEKLLKFRDFPANAPIVEKGKPLKSMFFLQSGSVEVPGESEGEAVLELNAGESFGMMGIVFVEPRSSTIRAKTACSLYELEKKPLDKLLEHYPEIAARVNKLASERLVMSKLRQGQSSEKTQARFQEVLAMQKARFAGASAKAAQAPAPGVRPAVSRPGFAPRRTAYNEAEKHLIHEALEQGKQCLEVHVFIHRTSMMKGARAYLIILMLSKLGQIIRSEPTLEAIQSEQPIGAEVVITLATKSPLDQVIEDATVAEIDRVEVIQLGQEDA